MVVQQPRRSKPPKVVAGGGIGIGGGVGGIGGASDPAWRTWRAGLMREREREIPWILKLQSYRTPFLDRYFRLASMLGEELFYILFLPLSSWILSSQFAMHLTMLLALSVGLGNVLKNIFLIPRPPHPPVWVHEDCEKDHGLPSTHTMTAITLPWYYLVFFGYLDPQQPISTLTIVLAVVWSVSVITSRLYNGHHTPMDVVAGFILGVGILWLWTFHMRPVVDDFIISKNIAGVLTVIGTSVSILLIHPTPPKILTPAYAETGLVTGTATGTFLGCWIRLQHDPRSIYLASQHLFHLDSNYPIQFELLAAHPLLVNVLRFIVGAVLVVVVRLVVKKVATSLVLWIARIINKNKFPTKMSIRFTEAEAAVKYITYTAIGFSATCLANIVFVFIGLHHSLDDIVLSK